MKSYIVNCRIVDTLSLSVIEDAIIVLDHAIAEQAPDYIEWCGNKDDIIAPDINAVADEDKVVDVNGATVIPGLIDINSQIDNGIGNVAARTLSTYRNCGKALCSGLLAVGSEKDDSGVIDAVKACTQNIDLWGSTIIINENKLQTSSVVSNIFDLSHQQLAELIKEKNANISVGTGKIPYDYQDKTYPIRQAAKRLVKAGMTPIQAISAISYNNAKTLGLQDKCGRVHTGYEGDFIIIDDKVDQDISKIENIRLVSKGGRLVWSTIKGFELSRYNVLPPGYVF
jgi:adenine deaminase